MSGRFKVVPYKGCFSTGSAGLAAGVTAVSAGTGAASGVAAAGAAAASAAGAAAASVTGAATGVGVSGASAIRRAANCRLIGLWATNAVAPFSRQRAEIATREKVNLTMV